MTSKFAATVLSTLLYAQAFLCIGGFTAVVLKNSVHSEPVFVMGTASLDAARVN